MKEVFHFFLKPGFFEEEKNFNQKIRNLLNAIKFDLFIFALFFIILSVDFVLSKHIGNQPILIGIIRNRNTGFDERYTPLVAFFLKVSVIPIIEELAFRGFLNFKKKYVGVSIVLLAYTFFAISFEYFGVSKNLFYLKYIFGAFFGVFVLLLINEYTTNTFIDKLKSSHFTSLFYLSNLGFVLVHIFNYSIMSLTISQTLLFPIILMPQISASIALSYLRIKNGLIWSIGFHSVSNLIFSIPYLLASSNG